MIPHKKDEKTRELLRQVFAEEKTYAVDKVTAALKDAANDTQDAEEKKFFQFMQDRIKKHGKTIGERTIKSIVANSKHRLSAKPNELINVILSDIK